MANDKIDFTMSEPRFDENTYWGRVQSLFEASNIRYAFKTKAQVIQEYQKVKAHEKREQEALEKTGSPKVKLTADEVEELRHATNIVKAAIHPDTQEPIPMPMRITFFVPGQIPIGMGMLFSRPTIFNTVFWQIINQTYNALLNFGNANKSSPVTSQDIAMSYVGAVAVACSSGAAIRMATAPMLKGASGVKEVALNTVVTIVACAAGGWANNYIIRQPEVNVGISVEDPADGKKVGISKKCADAARWQTANSRIMMALPIMFPGIMFALIDKLGMTPKGSVGMNALRISLLATQLTFAVPLSMACYPQIQHIKVNELEPEFQNVRSAATGDLIKEFRYNKGL